MKTSIFVPNFDRMMTRYRFMTATWLLVVSMVMLAAMVVPHHHHWGMYCVALCEADDDVHDACHRTSDETNHNHDENDCCNGCITKFCCPRPSLYDGLTDEAVPVTLAAYIPVFSDGLFPERELPDSSFFYPDKLYRAFVGGPLSLRAPPFCC